MIVIGGTYHERVVMPDSDHIVGSGVRAAAALALTDNPPTLYTAVDDATADEAEMVRTALGVHTDPHSVVPRTESVGFRYVTPLSAPSINGPASELKAPIKVDAPSDTVLRIGLIERGQEITVSANIVVLDPQKPRDTERLSFKDVRANRIVVVANGSEAFQLGGEPLILAAGASGVVTKLAAAGCTVSWLDGGEFKQEHLGAHPTTRVWPIGSGDVFSAGLAHALDLGADLVEAARVASAAAAHWCSTKSVAVPLQILSGDTSGLPKALAPSRPRIYIAAPFFSVGELWLVELVREALAHLGAAVFSPFHDVGVGGVEVAAADLDGLRSSDAVLALLDGSDPGTVFEVGWAVREGIPTIGYGTLLNEEVVKMMAGTTVELHRDLSTACYRAVWAGMGLRPRRGWLS